MKTASDWELKHVEVYLDSVGLYFFETMVHACHNLTRINEVCMRNLGLGKVKQETTASKITLFYRITMT